MMRNSRGFSVILVVVFSAVFLTITTSLVGFIFIQQRSQLSKANGERARQIAEAGLDYYKWFLAHYPDDLTDGTGQPGPYEHAYTDPETGEVGSFSLSIEGTEYCDILSSADITSEGWVDDDPTIKRTVYGRYARPSVAEHAYILNSNVWAGADRVIIGPYHSNGGIRMDGDNRSTVSSGLLTWSCTSTFGCSPASTTPGVWGAGDHPELWEYPVPPIDFAGISVDLSQLKTVAQSSGIYLPQDTANLSQWNNNQRGYRLVFQSNGTVTVYRVNGTSWIWSYNLSNNQSQDEGHVREYDVITSQTSSGVGLGNRTIPSDCPIIFVEGKVWVEGTVEGKVTIASANLIDANIVHDVVLSSNLMYATTTGSEDGITVIGERSVRIPLLSPQNMDLQGIFIAQTGNFGRNHYKTSGSYDVPSSYDSYVQQGILNLGGTIVSNGREGTRWTTNGSFSSGYSQRNNTYDRNLASQPPPLTPYISNDYRFIEWREDN
jgi:hypothetical protein